jgi:putative glutamine amidotransferase
MRLRGKNAAMQIRNSTIMNKPVIGITPDRDDAPGNIEAHFLVRQNYCAAVADGGAAPLILPYRMESIEAYLNLVDGIVLTGGMFDVDPAMYGVPAKYPEQMRFKHDRTDFELALLRGALAREMPVLGICGGMQLIAVELGAQLIQHIPSEIGVQIEHKQGEPCNLAAHRVQVEAGTLLHRVLGVDTCTVNSLHHQSVAGGNARLRVGAVADDGVVEAIEGRGLPFCLGVQWHPEYGVDPSERNIFTELARAAERYALQRPLPIRD